jgi:hypothetical protein
MAFFYGPRTPKVAVVIINECHRPQRPLQKLTYQALIGFHCAHNLNVPGFYAGRNAKEII